MKTQYWNIEDPSALDEAIRLLLLGEVIAFPTETVYGLGVHYSDKGLKTLYKIKNRNPAKPIAVCLDSYESIKNIVNKVPELFWILAKHFLPGPLTIVFSSEEGSIGIRIPEHGLCRELLKKTGPLYVTSANYSTNGDIIHPLEVYQNFEGIIAGILVDNNKLKYNKCSTVIQIEGSNSIKLLREGPILWETIQASLH